MKKLVVLFTMIIGSMLYASGQKSGMTIHGYQFTFHLNDISEYDNTMRSLSVFKDDIDTPVIVFLLDDIYGDCNSQVAMLGDYEVSGDDIILYHIWVKAGDAPVSPYGARIQTYHIDETGGLVLAGGKIYIETVSDGYIVSHMDKVDFGYHTGCIYLHNTPVNEEEHELLEAYIAGVEKEYDAQFVFGEDAERLFDKVRDKLSDELERHTGNWELYYGNNSFGYRK